MAIRAQYGLLCDDARQSMHNTFDLMGVFDRIFVTALPSIHRRMTFVCLLVADDEDDLGKHAFDVTLEAPNGHPMATQTGALHLKPDAGSWLASARILIGFEGLPVHSTGKYWIRVRVGDREVANHPLSVVLAKDSK